MLIHVRYTRIRFYCILSEQLKSVVSSTMFFTDPHLLQKASLLYVETLIIGFSIKIFVLLLIFEKYRFKVGCSVRDAVLSVIQ